VPDVDAAVEWYRDVLGFDVLSPPYRMEGAAIADDMGELVPAPVVVTAAIVGVAGDGEGDRVLELIEYPMLGDAAPRAEGRAPSVVVPGFTHVGLLCDDIATRRSELEDKGVQFLVSRIAEIAGLRTTWFTDPWGNVFILLEKARDASRPYYRQYSATTAFRNER
jgi:catechol 2,3-dioxygenase-like lactoylglutathione lyase family enzyme